MPPVPKRRVVAADAWLRDGPVVEEEGLAHLVRRFLAAFGPATAKDASRWARLPLTRVRGALVFFRVDKIRPEDTEALARLTAEGVI